MFFLSLSKCSQLLFENKNKKSFFHKFFSERYVDVDDDNDKQKWQKNNWTTDTFLPSSSSPFSKSSPWRTSSSISTSIISCLFFWFICSSSLSLSCLYHSFPQSSSCSNSSPFWISSKTSSHYISVYIFKSLLLLMHFFFVYIFFWFFVRLHLCLYHYLSLSLSWPSALLLSFSFGVTTFDRTNSDYHLT